MGIFNEFNKKEKPVFTGITRGLGGFGFGAAATGGGSPGVFSLSGGTKIPAATANDGYTYHVFTGADTWENTSGTAGEVDILLVAGGASGGLSGGGGGAGGVAFGNAFPIGASDGPYNIAVGAGGAASPFPSPDHRGKSGNNTTFNYNGGSFVAYGGGAGGKGSAGPGPTQNAAPGGSGGGVGRDNPSASAGSVISPQPSHPKFTRYGNAGGAAPSTGGNSGGGGGGGAGEAGRNNKPSSYGDGGHGILIPAFPAPVIAPAIPSSVRTSFTNAVKYYGAYGGGGGGGGYSYTASSGGNGGGGWGDSGNLSGSGPSVSQEGCDYTGGGSGGTGGGNGGVPGNTGKGGDGLCVLRYTENTTKATGGFVSFIGSKTVHAFTRNCGMTQFINPATLTVEVVAVGGGGGGGYGTSSAGAGGGAGAVYHRTGYSLPAATHPLSVGAGADGPTAATATTFSPSTMNASATAGAGGAGGPGSQGGSAGGYPSNGNASSGPYVFASGAGSNGSGNASGGGGGSTGNAVNATGNCGGFAGFGGSGKPFTNVATVEIKLGSGGGGGNRCAPGGAGDAGAGGDGPATPAPTFRGWDITTWARTQGGPGAQEFYSAGYTSGPQATTRGFGRTGNYGLPGTGSGGGGTHQYTNESPYGGRGGDGILYVLYDT